MKSWLKTFLLLAFSLAAACGSGNESSSPPDPSQIDIGVDWMVNFNRNFGEDHFVSAVDCPSFLAQAEAIPSEFSCDGGNYEIEPFLIRCENFAEEGTAGYNFKFNDCRWGPDLVDGEMSAYYNYDGKEFRIIFGVGISLVVNGIDFEAREIFMHYSDVYMRYFCNGVFYPDGHVCEFSEDCGSCVISGAPTISH